MGEIIAAVIILYIIYKLVFDFVVPIVRTTSHFKSQVNKAQRMQEEQMRQQQQKQQTSPAPKTKPSSKKNTTTTDGEYIDFEEVK
jgi:hypothetical protein